MERDTVIFDLIKKECQRQKEGIELIASENFVSDEVMDHNLQSLPSRSEPQILF